MSLFMILWNDIICVLKVDPDGLFRSLGYDDLVVLIWWLYQRDLVLQVGTYWMINLQGIN